MREGGESNRYRSRQRMHSNRANWNRLSTVDGRREPSIARGVHSSAGISRRARSGVAPDEQWWETYHRSIIAVSASALGTGILVTLYQVMR
jgi:hypothetical protein